MPKFKIYRQLEMSDCGPACIQMVCAFYGKKHTLHNIKDKISVSRIGVTVGDIKRTCENIGLQTIVAQGTVAQLSKIQAPTILHWRGNHFVVLFKTKNTHKGKIYYVADPSYGKLRFTEQEFIKNWYGDDGNGIAIITSPTKELYAQNYSSLKSNSIVLNRLACRIVKNKFLLIGVTLCLFFSMVCNWFSPIIFQKIIDLGVLNCELSIVWKLFLAQFAIFTGYIVSNSLNSILLTKLNFYVGIGYLTELLRKIIRLPLKYFETRLNTEFIQRFDDFLRLQSFLTEKMVAHLFALLNLIVFSIILCNYNLIMFGIFFVSSVLSCLWNNFFMVERKYLDYSRFTEQARNRNILYELINGMIDIKINNAQETQVSIWEENQSHINEITLKTLMLGYKQSLGSQTISKFCEIIILGLCAILTIKNDITLGVLISINYILGQLASPLILLQHLPQDIQDARISLERLAEVQMKDDEKLGSKQEVNLDESIVFKNVTFKYEGSFNPFIFNNLTLHLKKKTVTAIVGNSGSGKTTLVKLLLGLYSPHTGEILIGNSILADMNLNDWRRCCGAVMQDGYIFSGTIAENIALGEKNIDYEKVEYSAKQACIYDFIVNLPSKFNMKIGKSGLELSQGQKQRILIARAVYKNPQLLVFDEATSSLDTINERKIMDNLSVFFNERTVVIVAHRLSTVVRADNIIYLDNGKIAEQGTHKELVARRGKYYELIKNQLELEQ